MRFLLGRKHQSVFSVDLHHQSTYSRNTREKTKCPDPLSRNHCWDQERTTGMGFMSHEGSFLWNKFDATWGWGGSDVALVSQDSLRSSAIICEAAEASSVVTWCVSHVSHNQEEMYFANNLPNLSVLDESFKRYCKPMFESTWMDDVSLKTN